MSPPTTPFAQLLLANGALGQSNPATVAANYNLASQPPNQTACTTGNTQYYSRTWTPTWTSTSVQVPAGNFSAVMGQYSELGGGAGNNYERWYFANNVGPVQIIEADANWNPLITLKLVQYTAGSGTAISPFPSLRDALIARAGATSGKTFNDWATIFAQVTNPKSPTAAQACTTSGSLITVDQYLINLELVGNGTCTVVQYPTINGQTVNNIIYNMESDAATKVGQQSWSTWYGYNWDQWNYWFNAVTGQYAPGPDTMCMQTYSGSSSSVTAYNRFLLVTPRQWFLFYEHSLFGCAS